MSAADGSGAYGVWQMLPATKKLGSSMSSMSAALTANAQAAAYAAHALQAYQARWKAPKSVVKIAGQRIRLGAYNPMLGVWAGLDLTTGERVDVSDQLLRHGVGVEFEELVDTAPAYPQVSSASFGSFVSCFGSPFPRHTTPRRSTSECRAAIAEWLTLLLERGSTFEAVVEFNWEKAWRRPFEECRHLADELGFRDGPSWRLPVEHPLFVPA